MKHTMTPEEEFDYYAQPENQEPQGPARRRTPRRFIEIIPVRFTADALAEIRRRANKEDRSLSAWIRRTVEHELKIVPNGRVHKRVAG